MNDRQPPAPSGPSFEASEAPRDCKHGQLARSCGLCELEAEEHILRYGGIIEVAVRNQNVAEYMGHWEDRAEKAEAALRALSETGDSLNVDKMIVDELSALLNEPPAHLISRVKELLAPQASDGQGTLRCPPQYVSTEGEWEDCDVPDHCAQCGGTKAEHIAHPTPPQGSGAPAACSSYFPDEVTDNCIRCGQSQADHTAASAQIAVEPHSGAWKWIDEAVKVMQTARHAQGVPGSSLGKDIDDLLHGTPCPQEDLSKFTRQHWSRLST